MKKIWNHLNYVAIILFIVGFALWMSYGSRNIFGMALILLGVAAFAAYIAVNRRRLKTKNSRLNFIFASNILVIVVLLIAIVGAVNYLGTKIHKRIDLSEGKVHSLADQSIQVAKNLKKEMNIKAFVSENNPARFRFNSLMDIYRYYTDKFRIELIDPYKNPSMVKRYEIKTDGTVVFEYDKRDTRIEDISEEAITNALIKVTRTEEKTVFILQGHGEPDPDKNDENGFSEVKNNLEKLSFRVKKLYLFQEPRVPGNAAAVVIAGLQKPLLESEVACLENYIEQQNGRVLFMINPFEGNEVKALLKKLGVVLEDNIVVEADTMSRLMGGDYFMPVVANYPDHAITKNFSYATLFPMVRGLAKTEPLPKDTTVDILASTSPYSWGETSYDEEIKTQRMSKNGNDKNGPIDIAMASQIGMGSDKKARIVVIGDSDFAINKYYYFQANSNFFNNIISWITEEGDLIAISPKTNKPQMISLTQSGSRLIFFYSIIILPLLVLLAGIGIWLYRRKL